MKEPTKEEIKKILCALIYDFDGFVKSAQPHDKIVLSRFLESIILGLENQPGVDEKFINELFLKYAKQRMAKNLQGFPNDLFAILNHKQFIAMLQEAGVRIKEKEEG